MSAATLDLKIEGGATYVLSIVYRNDDGTLVDLTGWTARMGFRKDLDQAAPDLLLTETDGIALGGVAGTIIVTITGARTAALAGLGFQYDLTVTNNGVPERLLDGVAHVKRAASR